MSRFQRTLIPAQTPKQNPAGGGDLNQRGSVLGTNRDFRALRKVRACPLNVLLSARSPTLDFEKKASFGRAKRHSAHAHTHHPGVVLGTLHVKRRHVRDGAFVARLLAVELADDGEAERRTLGGGH
jgi:hypothetical protein